jgi:hypothetical protein
MILVAIPYHALEAARGRGVLMVPSLAQGSGTQGAADRINRSVLLGLKQARGVQAKTVRGKQARSIHTCVRSARCLKQTGQRARVAYVLTTTISREQRNLHVTLNLISTRTGDQVASESVVASNAVSAATNAGRVVARMFSKKRPEATESSGTRSMGGVDAISQADSTGQAADAEDPE